ncbi:MAG TPA: aminotransferase class V-fold PLP-dependent enzyme [Candidatus Acidoferrum sp.]|nr:aminotransferase class V-fold PLP-dependent enzyme [Candidatus Acidoferrum sp.]
MRKLLEDASQRAIRYLERLDERNVAPTPEARSQLAMLESDLPDSSMKADDVLKQLDEFVSPATMAMAGPRFFGFVIGGSLPAALAANWLAGAWDQNSAFYDVTPGTAFLEELALSWLIKIFKLPAKSGCAFVTGATLANFSALAAARHAALTRAGWNVESDGLIGAPEIKVVVGAEAHPTLFKSLGLLGLGRNKVTKVPVDSQGRMRADALPSLSSNTILCVQAGNVNTGAFDPIQEICRRAHDAGAWVHVDGAFGLWASAAPTRSYLTKGVEEADSWATDAHKWLNVPYDSGLAFVRDPETLRGAMAVSAEYLPTSMVHRNPSDFTPELSRRARGVEVWAALRSLGRTGLADLIERTCRHARRFAEGLSEAGYEVLNEVVLNQVLVSFDDADTTNKIIAELQADGTCWCGGTVWQGNTAMRISVSSWATTDLDVQKSLDAMLRIAAKHRKR